MSIEAAYKGEHVRATIQPDGSVVWRDQTYASLSRAGGYAIGGVNGRDANESVDGWIFWRFRDADGQLKRLDALRRRYREQLSGT